MAAFSFPREQLGSFITLAPILLLFLILYRKPWKYLLVHGYSPFLNLTKPCEPLFLEKK